MLTGLIRNISLATILIAITTTALADQYLVVGSDGPGFASSREALEILENGVFPAFDALKRLEKERKILAGGLPVGDSAFVFIPEAASNDEADRMVRDIPGWGVFTWQITPLQSFDGGAAKERNIVAALKKQMK